MIALVIAGLTWTRPCGNCTLTRYENITYDSHSVIHAEKTDKDGCCAMCQQNEQCGFYSWNIYGGSVRATILFFLSPLPLSLFRRRSRLPLLPSSSDARRSAR